MGKATHVLPSYNKNKTNLIALYIYMYIFIYIYCTEVSLPSQIYCYKTHIYTLHFTCSSVSGTKATQYTTPWVTGT